MHFGPRRGGLLAAGALRLEPQATKLLRICCCSLALVHRRAVAACERLVLLCGEACPWERRDLAVLYMHLGQFRGERSAAVDVLLMRS